MKILLFKSQDIIILTPLDPGLAHKPSPSTFSSSLQLSKDYKKNIFNLTVIKESSMPLKSSKHKYFSSYTLLFEQNRDIFYTDLVHYRKHIKYFEKYFNF